MTLKYQIDVAARLKAAEAAGMTDEKSKEFIQHVAELENQAYKQGLNDGFLRPYGREITEPDTTEELDEELRDALRELRDKLEREFLDTGLDTVLHNLSPAPEGVTWGEKLFCLAMEAFVVGAFTAITNYIGEQEETTNA